ncbi:protein kinase [Roseiconus lacunae]|uniref:protein kinase domain-containing protein n=1 Tax=Roseiconus lacunae TaxID=2605694 RepID=UPI003086B25C|nr:protein kinase [Stieleria sp. HD01]
MPNIPSVVVPPPPALPTGSVTFDASSAGAHPSDDPARSMPPSMLVLTDWRPLPSDVHCNAFWAKDRATDVEYEIRLVPWGVQSTWQAKLREQQRLTQLIAGVASRPLVSVDLDQTPPKLISLANVSLSAFVDQLSNRERLACAAQIIGSVERALLGGLIHGAISMENIVRNDQGIILIDYFARFYSAESEDASFSAQTDAIATTALLRDLLCPVLDDKSILGDGQRRGQFRSLMRAEVSSQAPIELLDRWSTLLTNVVETEPNPATEDDPAIFTVRFGEPEEERPEEGIEDSTCEIFVDSGDDPTEINEDQTGIVEVGSRVQTRPTVSLPGIGDTIAHYRLDALLGEGGMGMVYRATDSINQTDVAIKLLRPTGGDIAQAVRRFKKEARLLAGLNNPFVTRLFDSGVDRGVHYLALEFVDGMDLKRWMKTLGPMDEATALHLVADLARALVEAHQLEIVHRDIKPENILLASEDATQLTPHAFQLKLTDFGIARAMQQTASMEVTKAGALLGTPTYMAPEQFKGEGTVTPAADIYAIGITLYAMLAGEPPFQSDDPMNLAAKHCFDSPADIRKRNQSVSESTAALLSRMLAKAPADRPADAGQLVHEIDRLLRGQINDFQQHPHLPDAPDGPLWERTFEWDLQSSSRQLWPHVSNTDRLNRAAGLQSVDYRTEKDPHHGLRKFGSFKLAGMRIEWEEHPFEWIEGRRMGILREFQSGPFRWFLSLVELQTLPCGGTRLTHTVRIAPRNFLGRCVATIEAGWKGGRALDRIYRRIDRSLQKEKTNPLFDPFEKSESLKQTARRRLDRRLDQMIEMGVPVEIATPLVAYIRDASPQSLAQIRPIELADRLGLSGEAVADACLVAAHCGVMQLRWDILCPSCRVPASQASILTEIERHTHCEACDAEFQSDISSAIELVFQAHAEIRQVDQGQYCVGGPEHSPHVVAQSRLKPGERLEINVPLTKGDYLIRRSGVGNVQNLQVQTRSASSSVEIWLSELGGARPLPLVRSGNANLIFQNDLDHQELVRVERTIRRSNVLTAAVASALPRFRELFPDQVLSRDGAITSDDLTLLAIRIGGGESLYESKGDAQAYAIIQQAIGLIEESVACHDGATIKSLGETVLASFRDPARALSTAITIGQRLEKREDLSAITFSRAIHRGTLLVTTQNGRLDYFGTTARQVLALANEFADGISLTDSVFTDPAVQERIASATTSPRHHSVDLPGGKNRLVQRFLTEVSRHVGV